MGFQTNILMQRFGKALACLLVVSQIAPVMAESSQPLGNLIMSDDVVEFPIAAPVEKVILETAQPRLTPIVETASSEPALAPLEAAGQFRLISADVIEFSGEVDANSPANFSRMLEHNPDVTTLQLHDVAGTVDDMANFRLARIIRDQQLTVYVPSYGSVRSGGIELFAAGAHRIAEPGAEFLVHSWQDDAGYEAGDYPLSDPIHQEYLRFYREMGLADEDAVGFYLLTNSASFDDALQLSLNDLERYGLLS